MVSMTRDLYSEIKKYAEPFIAVYSESSWGYSIYLVEKTGSGIIRITVFNTGGNICIISDFNVYETEQRKGIGRSLLDMAETIARKFLGCNRATLYAEDTWVKDWYAKNGYVVIEDNSEIALTPEFQADYYTIFMEKDLMKINK